MQIMSSIFDKRINSTNLYVETTFGEYLSFAKLIIKNNDLQRKRVKTSKTVYSLLKTDLKRGCVIPPLVLAVTKRNAIDLSNIKGEDLLSYIQAHIDETLILDGLQRTYTLIDADTEMSAESHEKYTEFLNFKLRLEIYLEINKFGVLYRMLTLNTGQTPMSARHQLEMLYNDMLNTEIDGVKLVSEVDGTANPSKNEFQFKNAVEGFHSYLNRNELPIDREELLHNIKMLENMAEENVNNDLFGEYLSCYIQVFSALRKSTNDAVLTEDDWDAIGITSRPFGNTVYKVFSTSQALTGFGAAIGRMKDRDIISSFAEINKMATQFEEDPDAEWFDNLLLKLNLIKESAKKIGNAQRMFFHYFFRELFNSDSDSYLNLKEAVENGYRKYCSQVN